MYPGQIETIAWETAFPMSLRNYFEEARRKVSMRVIFVKGEDMQASTYFFFLQKVSAGLMKVSASLVKVSASQEQTSPWRILVFFPDMRRHRNWAHEIS